MRPTTWNVRVKRVEETWVSVSALTAYEAEIEAAKLPRVMAVFARSAVRGDEVAIPERPEGVRE